MIFFSRKFSLALTFSYVLPSRFVSQVPEESRIWEGKYSLAIRSDLFKGSLFSRLLLTCSSPKVIGLELHPLGQLNMWGSLLEEFFFFFFFGGDQNIIIEEK